MTHEHEQPPHHHDGEDDALDLDPRTNLFLLLRQQNIELLQIAAKVAGYHGEHPPLKPGDLKQALRTIWDVYSEFYAWVDPEDDADDDDEFEDE